MGNQGGCQFICFVLSESLQDCDIFKACQVYQIHELIVMSFKLCFKDKGDERGV